MTWVFVVLAYAVVSALAVWLTWRRLGRRQAVAPTSTYASGRDLEQLRAFFLEALADMRQRDDLFRSEFYRMRFGVEQMEARFLASLADLDYIRQLRRQAEAHDMDNWYGAGAFYKEPRS
jgi:hypothetical protein